MKETVADINFSEIMDQADVDTSDDEILEELLSVGIENSSNLQVQQPVTSNAVVQTVNHRSETDFEYVSEDTAFVSINYLGIDPATGLIEVFVHINKKENFILQRTATIGSLKQMIFERKGIPLNLQRLVFTGKILRDETTLTENRIECGSNIHMFISIRGGVTKNCKDNNGKAQISNMMAIFKTERESSVLNI